MKRDPRIDQKIAQAAPFARPILEHFRALVHRTIPTAEEAIKWGMPHFTYNGKNIAGMAAFKAHCAVMIHGEGRQGEAADGGGMGSFGKIASLDDLPGEEELAGKLRDAQARIDAAGTATRKKPAAARSTAARSIPMQDDLAAALAADPAAARFWDTLAASHRYEYLQWITEAKRTETRARRVAQTLEWLAEGKRRNWKYERC